jgi:hypothetical protein
MKTIATTIKADVVIYQDGSVEVLTDTTDHASSTPAVVELATPDAFLIRRTVDPAFLSYAGMVIGWNQEASLQIDRAERLGFDWTQAMIADERGDKVADLAFDRAASQEQARWCINGVLPYTDTERTRMIAAWETGFHYAVCLALRNVDSFRSQWDLAKRLSDATPAQPAPTY